MKNQITIALLILAAFVGWLYFHSIRSFELNEKEISLKEFQLTQGLNLPDYSIVNDPDGMTYLLNKRDGTTWRWYRNMKEGKVENEGWTPVSFNVLSYDYADAESANQYNKAILETIRKIKANQSGDDNSE